MFTTLTQEAIDEYAGAEGTITEKPGNPYYNDGVEVRYTANGKWWNWLWNAITKWLGAHKKDYQDMITEETNLVTSAGLSPASSNPNLIGQSFHDISAANAEVYDKETVVEEGVERPVNLPYVSGDTIILPDTELL